MPGQKTWFGAGQVHTLFVQVADGKSPSPMHEAPQLPQLFASIVSSTQAGGGGPPVGGPAVGQKDSPPVQQLPFEQVPATVPPAVQSTQLLPQFVAAVTSTHVEPSHNP